MGTWLVGSVVFAAIALAARKVYRDRKSGNGCGCGYDACSSCRSCPIGDRRPRDS